MSAWVRTADDIYGLMTRRMVPSRTQPAQLAAGNATSPRVGTNPDDRRLCRGHAALGHRLGALRRAVQLR